MFRARTESCAHGFPCGVRTHGHIYDYLSIYCGNKIVKECTFFQQNKKKKL